MVSSPLNHVPTDSGSFSDGIYPNVGMSREATMVPREHIIHGLLANELLFEQKAQNLGAEEFFNLVGVEIEQMAEGSIW